MTCPKCGSTDTIDTVRLEQCNRCGWYQYYGDAHATGDAAISRSSDYDPREKKDS
jgi:Zn ribbon nucleic-acid-binding protein